MTTRDRILGHDVHARLVGLGLILAGIGMAAYFIVPEARGAMAHSRVLIHTRGVVAAPALAAYLGLILLVAGRHSRDLMSYREDGTMSRAQWALTGIGLVFVLGLEFGFSWWLGRLGYAP